MSDSTKSHFLSPTIAFGPTQPAHKLPPMPAMVISLSPGLPYEMWKRGSDCAFGAPPLRNAPTLREAHDIMVISRLQPLGIGPLRLQDIYGEQAHSNDGWKLREEFFAIKSEHDALRFLQAHGPFLASDDQPPRRRKGKERGFEVSFSDLQCCQRMLRSALLGTTDAEQYPPELSRASWKEIPLKITPTDKGPVAVMPFDSGLKAIWTTIVLDRAWEGVEFLPCKREDCHRIFRKERKNQDYCSPSCTHTAAVRAWRGRKTAAAVTKKRGKV